MRGAALRHRLSQLLRRLLGEVCGEVDMDLLLDELQEFYERELQEDTLTLVALARIRNGS